MEKNIKTILKTVIQEEKDNTIQSYTYDGLEIQQSERVIMRNTLLLHLFNADSFLILRCKKYPEVEYDSFRNSLEMLFISGISHEGRLYKLLGGGSSLKDGKVLMATDDVITTLQPQFSNCAELLSYMGIYTSSNSFGIYDLVYSLGIMEQAYQSGGIISEDGQGFIPISLIEELNLPIRQLLHSFRTTFNNRLRDLGLQIEDRQILLAQSASETTKIYTHPNFELAKQYVNKIPEIMGL